MDDGEHAHCVGRRRRVAQNPARRRRRRMPTTMATTILRILCFCIKKKMTLGRKDVLCLVARLRKHVLCPCVVVEVAAATVQPLHLCQDLWNLVLEEERVGRDGNGRRRGGRFDVGAPCAQLRRPNVSASFTPAFLPRACTAGRSSFCTHSPIFLTLAKFTTASSAAFGNASRNGSFFFTKSPSAKSHEEDIRTVLVGGPEKKSWRASPAKAEVTSGQRPCYALLAQGQNMVQGDFWAPLLVVLGKDVLQNIVVVEEGGVSLSSRTWKMGSKCVRPTHAMRKVGQVLARVVLWVPQ